MATDDRHRLAKVWPVEHRACVHMLLQVFWRMGFRGLQRLFRQSAKDGVNVIQVHAREGSTKVLHARRSTVLVCRLQLLGRRSFERVSELLGKTSQCLRSCFSFLRDMCTDIFSRTLMRGSTASGMTLSGKLASLASTGLTYSFPTPKKVDTRALLLLADGCLPSCRIMFDDSLKPHHP